MVQPSAEDIKLSEELEKVRQKYAGKNLSEDQYNEILRAIISDKGGVLRSFDRMQETRDAFQTITGENLALVPPDKIRLITDVDQARDFVTSKAKTGHRVALDVESDPRTGKAATVCIADGSDTVVISLNAFRKTDTINDLKTVLNPYLNAEGRVFYSHNAKHDAEQMVKVGFEFRLSDNNGHGRWIDTLNDAREISARRTHIDPATGIKFTGPSGWALEKTGKKFANVHFVKRAHSTLGYEYLDQMNKTGLPGDEFAPGFLVYNASDTAPYLEHIVSKLYDENNQLKNITAGPGSVQAYNELRDVNQADAIAHRWQDPPPDLASIDGTRSIQAVRIAKRGSDYFVETYMYEKPEQQAANEILDLVSSQKIAERKKQIQEEITQTNKDLKIKQSSQEIESQAGQLAITEAVRKLGTFGVNMFTATAGAMTGSGKPYIGRGKDGKVVGISPTPRGVARSFAWAAGLFHADKFISSRYGVATKNGFVGGKYRPKPEEAKGVRYTYTNAEGNSTEIMMPSNFEDMSNLFSKVYNPMPSHYVEALSYFLGKKKLTGTNVTGATKKAYRMMTRRFKNDREALAVASNYFDRFGVSKEAIESDPKRWVGAYRRAMANSFLGLSEISKWFPVTYKKQRKVMLSQSETGKATYVSNTMRDQELSSAIGLNNLVGVNPEGVRSPDEIRAETGMNIMDRIQKSGITVPQGFDAIKNMFVESFAGVKVARTKIPGFSPREAMKVRSNLLESGAATVLYPSRSIHEGFVPGRMRFRQQRAAAGTEFTVPTERMWEAKAERDALLPMAGMFDEDTLINHMHIRSAFKEGTEEEKNQRTVDRLVRNGFSQQDAEDIIAGGGDELKKALSSRVLVDDKSDKPWWQKGRTIVDDEVTSYFEDMWANKDSYSEKIQKSVASALSFDENGNPLRDANGALLVGGYDTRTVGSHNEELNWGTYQGTIGQQFVSMITDKKFQFQDFLENIPSYDPEIYNTQNDFKSRRRFLQDSYGYFTQPNLTDSIPTEDIGLITANKLQNVIKAEKQFRDDYPGEQGLSNGEILKLNRTFNNLLRDRVLTRALSSGRELEKNQVTSGFIDDEVRSDYPGLEYGSYVNYDEKTGKSTRVPFSALTTVKSTSMGDLIKASGKYGESLKDIHGVFDNPEDIKSYLGFIKDVENDLTNVDPYKVNPADAIIKFAEKFSFNNPKVWVGASNEMIQMNKAFTGEGADEEAVKGATIPLLNQAIGGAIPQVAGTVPFAKVGLTLPTDIPGEAADISRRPIGITHPDILQSLLNNKAIDPMSLMPGYTEVPGPTGTRYDLSDDVPNLKVNLADFPLSLDSKTKDLMVGGKPIGLETLSYNNAYYRIAQNISASVYHEALRLKKEANIAARKEYMAKARAKLTGSEPIIVNKLERVKKNSGHDEPVQDAKGGVEGLEIGKENEYIEALVPKHIRAADSIESIVDQLGDPDKRGDYISRGNLSPIERAISRAGKPMSVDEMLVAKKSAIVDRFMDIWGPMGADTWKSRDTMLKDWRSPESIITRDEEGNEVEDVRAMEETSKLFDQLDAPDENDIKKIRGDDIFGYNFKFLSGGANVSDDSLSPIGKGLSREAVAKALEMSGNQPGILAKMQKAITAFDEDVQAQIEGRFGISDEKQAEIEDIRKTAALHVAKTAPYQKPVTAANPGSTLYSWLTNPGVQESRGPDDTTPFESIREAFNEKTPGFDSLLDMKEQMAFKLNKGMNAHDAAMAVMREYHQKNKGGYNDAIGMVASYKPLYPEHPVHQFVPGILNLDKKDNLDVRERPSRASDIEDVLHSYVDYSKNGYNVNAVVDRIQSTNFRAGGWGNLGTTAGMIPTAKIANYAKTIQSGIVDNLGNRQPPIVGQVEIPEDPYHILSKISESRNLGGGIVEPKSDKLNVKDVTDYDSDIVDTLRGPVERSLGPLAEAGESHKEGYWDSAVPTPPGMSYWNAPSNNEWLMRVMNRRLRILENLAGKPLPGMYSYQLSKQAAEGTLTKPAIGVRKFGEGTPDVSHITGSGQAMGPSLVGEKYEKEAVIDSSGVRFFDKPTFLNFKNPATVIPVKKLGMFAEGTRYSDEDIVSDLLGITKTELQQYVASRQQILGQGASTLQGVRNPEFAAFRGSLMNTVRDQRTNARDIQHPGIQNLTVRGILGSILKGGLVGTVVGGPVGAAAGSVLGGILPVLSESMKRMALQSTRKKAAADPDVLGLYRSEEFNTLNRFYEGLTGTISGSNVEEAIDPNSLRTPAGANIDVSSHQHAGQQLASTAARQRALFRAMGMTGTDRAPAIGNVYDRSYGSTLGGFNQMIAANPAGTGAVTIGKDSTDLFRSTILGAINKIEQMGGQADTLRDAFSEFCTHINRQTGTMLVTPQVQDAFNTLTTDVNRIGSELQAFSGTEELKKTISQNRASPVFQQDIMRKGFFTQGFMNQRGFKKALAAEPGLTEEEWNARRYESSLTESIDQKLARKIRKRGEKGEEETMKLSFGGTFAIGDKESQDALIGVQSRFAAFIDAAKKLDKNLKVNMQSGVDQTGAGGGVLGKQFGGSIEISKEAYRKLSGGETEGLMFTQQVVTPGVMKEEAGKITDTRTSVVGASRSTRPTVENSGFLSTAAAIQGHGRRMTALSMGAMGTYFSVTGIYGAISQGIRMVTDSLSDLANSMKSIALMDAFGSSALKSADIMNTLGVKQEDFVEGWKKTNALGASFQVFLGTMAASAFTTKMKDGLTLFESLSQTLKGAFTNKQLVGQLVASIQELVKAGISLLPIFIQFASIMGAGAAWAASNKTIAGFVIALTMAAFVLQPLLTMVAVAMESFAVLLTLMAFIGPAMGSGALGMTQMAAGTSMAAGSVMTLNGALVATGAALLTITGYVALALAAWQALGFIIDKIAGRPDVIPTPISLISGAVMPPAVTGRCSGGPVGYFDEGGPVGFQMPAIEGLIPGIELDRAAVGIKSFKPGASLLSTMGGDVVGRAAATVVTGYDLGPKIEPQYAAGGGMIGKIIESVFGAIFKKQGTDTVPAMLTPGEFVLTKAASAAIGFQKLMGWNTQFKDGGGVVVGSSGTPALDSTANSTVANAMGTMNNNLADNYLVGKQSARVLTGASGGSYLNVKMVDNSGDWKGKGDEDIGFNPFSFLSNIPLAVADAFKGFNPAAAAGGAGAGGMAGFNLGDIWKKVGEVLGNAWKWLEDVFKNAWEGLKSALGRAWDFVKGIFDGFWNGLKEKLGRIWEKLGLPDLSEVWKGFKEAVKGLWKDLGLPTMEDVWKGASEKLTSIKDLFLKGLEDRVRSALGLPESEPTPKIQGPERAPTETNTPKGVIESLRNFGRNVKNTLFPPDLESFDRFNEPKGYAQQRGLDALLKEPTKLQFGGVTDMEGVPERPSILKQPSVRYALNQPFNLGELPTTEQITPESTPKVGMFEGFLNSIKETYRNIRYGKSIPQPEFDRFNLPPTPEYVEGPTVAEAVKGETTVPKSNLMPGWNEDGSYTAPEGYGEVGEVAKGGILNRIKGLATVPNAAAAAVGAAVAVPLTFLKDKGEVNEEALNSPGAYATVGAAAGGAVVINKALEKISEKIAPKIATGGAGLTNILSTIRGAPATATAEAALPGAKAGLGKLLGGLGTFIMGETAAEAGSRSGQFINNVVGDKIGVKLNEENADRAGRWAGGSANILIGGANPAAVYGQMASDTRVVMGEAGKAAQTSTQEGAGMQKIEQGNTWVFGDILTEMMNASLDASQLVRGNYEMSGNEGQDKATLKSGMGDLIVDLRTAILGGYGGIENGEMKRKGGIVEDVVKGFTGQSGDGSSGVVGDVLQGASGAGAAVGAAASGAGAATADAINGFMTTADEFRTKMSESFTGLIDSITTGGIDFAAGFLKLPEDIITKIKENLTGLNGLGDLVKAAIMSFLPGGNGVVGFVGQAIETGKKIVGAASGGLISSTGVIEAHAGEVIGPLDSVSNIISGSISKIGDSSKSINSGGNTYHISVPITVHGGTSSGASDIKRELEYLFPRLLKQYDPKSVSI